MIVRLTTSRPFHLPWCTSLNAPRPTCALTSTCCQGITRVSSCTGCVEVSCRSGSGSGSGSGSDPTSSWIRSVSTPTGGEASASSSRLYLSRCIVSNSSSFSIFSVRVSPICLSSCSVEVFSAIDASRRCNSSLRCLSSQPLSSMELADPARKPSHAQRTILYGRFSQKISQRTAASVPTLPREPGAAVAVRDNSCCWSSCCRAVIASPIFAKSAYRSKKHRPTFRALTFARAQIRAKHTSPVTEYQSPVSGCGMRDDVVP